MSSRVTFCHPSLWQPLPVGCDFRLPSNVCRPEPWQLIFLLSFDFIHSGCGISISLGSSFTWPRGRQEMAFPALTSVFLPLRETWEEPVCSVCTFYYCSLSSRLVASLICFENETNPKPPLACHWLVRSCKSLSLLQKFGAWIPTCVSRVKVSNLTRALSARKYRAGLGWGIDQLSLKRA